MGCCLTSGKRAESTMAKEPLARNEEKTEEGKAGEERKALGMHSRKSSKGPDDSKQTCADPKHISLDMNLRKSDPDVYPKVIELSVGAAARCAFVLDNGFLITSADVLPSLSDCSRLLPTLSFRTDLAFYSHPELNFSIVALEPASHPTGFPISDLPVALHSEVLISTRTTQIEYIGEHQLYYDCDAPPGCPILCKHKVIGLHESRGRGISLKGMCKVLATVSGCNSFVKRCVGEKEVLGQSPFWSKIFNIVHQRLLSFDIVSRKYQTYTRPIPAGALIAYYPSSLIITGGCEGEQPVATTLSVTGESHCFDVLRSMATTRARHSVCVHDSFLYAVSGVSHDGVTNECERFNQKKNQWLPIYPLSRGRVDSSCVSFRSSLYCYGGSNKYGRPVCEVERFENSTWTDVPFTGIIDSGKVALVAMDKDVLLLGESASMWDLKRVKTLGKTKEGVPGDTVVMRDGTLYVFIGVKVLEGRVLSNSVAWKTHDNASLNAYFSRL